MKPRIRFSLGILAAGFIALLAINPVWAQSYSHARIVRLSFVEGDVTVQRPDVQAWAEAPVNTPLQEGFKLSTGENSFAEIQFENGGTIRLGELALLDFTELELAPNGGKINHVELRQGYATFHPLPSRLGESLQVGTPYGTLIAQGGDSVPCGFGPGPGARGSLQWHGGSAKQPGRHDDREGFRTGHAARRIGADRCFPGHHQR